MKIDWFTVIAQLLNFLILVWLLKRFLYQPILDAIDAREKRIADELASADALQKEAKRESNKFAKNNNEFSAEKQKLIQDATNEAEAERKRMLTEAREQAKIFSLKQREASNRELKNLRIDLKHLVSEEVFSIARKVLADMADVSLEQQIIDSFLIRLQIMEDGDKADFMNVLKDAISNESNTDNESSSKESVQVCSAFELDRKQRNSIEKAFASAFSTETSVYFVQKNSVVSGIELSFSGQKISWSIDEYLTSLEQGLDKLEKDDPEKESATQNKAKNDFPESDPDAVKEKGKEKKSDTVEAVIP